jgi:hypothetical protein
MKLQGDLCAEEADEEIPRRNMARTGKCVGR